MTLRMRAATSTTALTALVGAALLVSAGTVRYPAAWAYIGFLWVVMMATNEYLLARSPRLLERRLASNRETAPTQRVVKAVLEVLAIALFVVAGLDVRFGWSHVPLALRLAAFGAQALGALVVFLVLRENRHAAVIVEVEQGQTVVTTGPYRFVRHPMYTGAVVQTVAGPLVLGSYWAECVALVATAVVIARLLDEERILRGDLSGWAAYADTTRHRLVPGVW